MELALKIALKNHETACYVEIDGWKQSRLRSRIRDGWLDSAPVHDDVETYDPAPYKGVDLVTSTYPCRWASTASRGRIITQSSWPQVQRTIDAIQPKYVFTENVAEDPLALDSLRESGYAVRTIPLNASQMGAPHLRRRVFMLGTYPDKGSEPTSSLDAEVVELPEPETPSRYPWDEPGRDVRVDDGSPYGLDEARAAGDALVPLVAAHALRTLVNRGAQLTLF